MAFHGNNLFNHKQKLKEDDNAIHANDDVDTEDDS